MVQNILPNDLLLKFVHTVEHYFCKEVKEIKNIAQNAVKKLKNNKLKRVTRKKSKEEINRNMLIK